MQIANMASQIMQRLRLNLPLLEDDNQALLKAFLLSEKNRKSLNDNLGLPLDWGRYTSQDNKIFSLYRLHRENEDISARKFAEKIVKELDAYKRNSYDKNRSAGDVPAGRDGHLHQILDGYNGKVSSKHTIRKVLTQYGDFLNFEISTDQSKTAGMKLAFSNKSTSLPAAPLERAAIKATRYDAQMSDFRARIRADRLELADLYQAGLDVPESVGDLQAAEIDALANSFMGDALVSQIAPNSPARSASALRKEMAALEKALARLVELASAERAQRIADEVRSRKEEWSDLQLEKALTEIKLREIERRCEDFKTSLVGPHGRPTLPCDVPLSRAMNTGEIKAHLEAAVHAGLISQKEAKL